MFQKVKYIILCSLVVFSGMFLANAVAETEAMSGEIVRVVFPGQFRPFYYKTSEGVYGGLEWSILEELKGVEKLQFEYTIAKDLGTALEMLKQGQADLLVSSNIDLFSQSDNFNYIANVASRPVSVFTERESSVEDLSSLTQAGRKVGLIKDIIPTSKILKVKENLRFIEFEYLDQGINSLLSGEVDALIAVQLAMSYRINELDICKRIRLVGENVTNIEFSYILAKENQGLYNAISRSLRKISNSGKYQNINNSWQERGNVSYKYHAIHPAIIYLSVAIVVALYLIYRLQSNIRKKTKMLRESKEYLRSILESAECIFLILTEGYIVKYANTYTLKTFGYRNDDIIGRNALEMLVPETDSEGGKPREQIKEMFQNHSGTMAIVNENITSEGKRIWTAWSNSRQKNLTTGETEIFSVGIDITIQKDIEIELKKLQQEKEVILNNMAGGVLFLNNELEIVSVNKEMEHITGSISQELIGKKCFDVICKNGSQCMNCSAVTAMETGQRYHHEIFTTINSHNFDVISSPLYNNIGRLTGTISIFTDVTQRKQLQDNLKSAHKAMEYYTRILEDRVRAGELKLEEKEENLKTAQDQLLQAEKMASLGKLIAGIGHEINTPLGAIRSSGEIIENAVNDFNQLTGDFVEWLRGSNSSYYYDMLEKANRANIVEIPTKELRVRREFIQNYLKAINVNEPVLVQKLIDIGIYQDIDQYREILVDPKIVNKVQIIQDISHIQHSAQIIGWAVDKAHNIVFALKNFIHSSSSNELTVTNIKENINMILVIYGNQLKHGIEVELELDDLPDILCNPDELNQVWSNLISNALHAMDYHGKLTIYGKAEENIVKITVQDTGCGIPEEIREMIFDTLFTTKAAGEGSGIGLDIVKTILAKHKGQITVESEVGQGSRFTVTLPINAKEKMESIHD